MTDTIDRLVIELETNFQKVIKDFESIEAETGDLQELLEELGKISGNALEEIADMGATFRKVAKTSDDFAESLENIELETSLSTQEMSELVDMVERINQSFKTASDRVEEMESGIDNLGTNALDSKGHLDELNGVLGLFGVTVGMSAAISAIESIGTFAIESADKFSEAMDIIALETGLADAELREYADRVKEISGMTPYSSESIASTMATLETLNRDADKEVVKDLAGEWQAFISMNPEASVEEFDRVFKKWGVPIEEQAGYLRAFNKIAQETHISMSSLSSSLADGDRGYQMMGKNLIEAAAYLGEANYAGELDDAMTLANTLEQIQAQKADILGSDEEAALYVKNVWEEAAELGDEGAIVQYLTKVEGLGNRVALSIAASVSSSAKSTESTVTTAKNAMATSLVDLDNQIQTTGDKWATIWNNMAIATEPVGNNLTEILDGLISMSQLWNAGDEGKLDVIGQLYRGYMAVTNPVTILPVVGRGLIEEGARQISNQINITQNISSPTPLDSARIRQETERAAKVASKSIFSR